MENMDWVILVTRWLHLASAIIAIGGAFFVRFALKPAATETLNDEAHKQLREAVRRRWSIVVMACITVLFLTGGFNFVMYALPPKIAAIPYHPIFGMKLLAALAVFFIASALAGRSPGFARMREQNAKWLGVLLGLAALIVLLSGVLNQVRTRPPSPTVQTTEHVPAPPS